MNSKNTFLPLVDQRYKNKTKNLHKAINLLQNCDLYTKNHKISAYQQVKRSSIQFGKSDQESIRLAQKYVQKFSTKNHQLAQNQNQYKAKVQDQYYQASSKKQKNSNQQKTNKKSDIKSSSENKTIIISPLKRQNPQQKTLNRKFTTQMSYDEMKQVKSILFSKQKRDSILKGKEKLLDKYGFLKSNMSKSLQKDLRVLRYRDKINTEYPEQSPSKFQLLKMEQKDVLGPLDKRTISHSDTKIYACVLQSVVTGEQKNIFMIKKPSIKYRYSLNRKMNNISERKCNNFSQNIKITKFELKPWVSYTMDQEIC